MTAKSTLAKLTAAANRDKLEAELVRQLAAYKLPQPWRQFKFDSTGRKWAFDFAYPALRLGIEIDGATWTGGRHVTGKGFAEDCIKFNSASLQGWTVLRFTGDHLRSGYAIDTLRTAIRERESVVPATRYSR